MSNSTINPELFPFDDDVHCALCTVCSDGDDVDTEDDFYACVEENWKEEKGEEEVNESSIWRKKLVKLF